MWRCCYCGINGEGEFVITIAAISIGVTRCIREHARCDGDDTVSVAVCIGAEDGGVACARAAEVGECASAHGDI